MSLDLTEGMRKNEVTGLAEGTRLRTRFNKELVVRKTLGDGSQGIVYEVEYDGRPMALKWYRPNVFRDRDKFIDNLRNNIMHGAPTDEFLWPVDMTDIVDGSFGYVMNLRPPEFVEAKVLFVRPDLFQSFRRAIDACLGVVSAFRVLHNKGYCYQDVNGGNFFINPQTGRVLICDNDNVAPAGTDTGIRGTPRFMAPEIVVKNTVPSMQSDRHSMSVLIFFLLLVQHPLEGRRVTQSAMLDGDTQMRLYGSDPLFVMDPNNAENRPDPAYPNVLRVWPCLPRHMQRMFERAFSQRALHEPNRRPTELEWIRELTRFRSEVVSCGCGNEVFMEDAHAVRCDDQKCGREVRVPLRAELSGYALPFVTDTRIYRCQTCVCNPDVALDPLAWVLQARGDAGVLGVRNISREPWRVVVDGRAHDVAPGEVVRVTPNMELHINSEVIRICRNS